MNKRLIKAGIAFIAIVSVVIGAVVFTSSTEFVRWQFDLIRGFSYSSPTETIRGHKVTLVHQAGGDFYDTYFDVHAPTGEKFRFLVDGDDHRWNAPQTKVIGNRVYFLPEPGEITSRTSYIDRDQGIVYAGYLGQTLNIFRDGSLQVSGQGYALGTIH